MGALGCWGWLLPGWVTNVESHNGDDDDTDPESNVLRHDDGEIDALLKGGERIKRSVGTWEDGGWCTVHRQMVSVSCLEDIPASMPSSTHGHILVLEGEKQAWVLA